MPRADFYLIDKPRFREEPLLLVCELAKKACAANLPTLVLARDTAQAALPPVLIWATVFLLISAIWVRKTSLIAFTILVAEGAPPIPALTALVAMTAVGYAFHRLTRTSRYRKQALLIYITMSLALVTLEANGVRQLLASLTVARYFAAPGNEYGAFADLLPEWMTRHCRWRSRDRSCKHRSG